MAIRPDGYETKRDDREGSDLVNITLLMPAIISVDGVFPKHRLEIILDRVGAREIANAILECANER